MELRLTEQEALTLYRIILRWDELGSLTTEDDEERQLLWDLSCTLEKELEPVSDAAQDFVNYILSKDGQQIITDNGYISVGEGKEFTSNNASGKLVIAGSSSVTPVMEKLVEAYGKVNANVEIEVQESDSSTGMQSTIDGLCDIGMASRELKDSETEAGLVATEIAKDGIAVIVNNESGITDLTSDQVKQIYTGEILTWDEVK